MPRACRVPRVAPPLLPTRTFLVPDGRERVRRGQDSRVVCTPKLSGLDNDAAVSEAFDGDDHRGPGRLLFLRRGSLGPGVPCAVLLELGTFERLAGRDDLAVAETDSEKSSGLALTSSSSPRRCSPAS